MLSDTEIASHLKKNELSIDPFNPAHLGAGSYQVHLGKIILVPVPTDQLINPLDAQTQPAYTKIDLTQEPFVLTPGMFVLGQTVEKIRLSSQFSAIIDGSSTLARTGLTIHQSATFISPGQDPHIITLEIKNDGIWNIQFTLGMKIGKLIFFKYESPNTVELKEANQYNGQDETIGALFPVV